MLRNIVLALIISAGMVSAGLRSEDYSLIEIPVVLPELLAPGTASHTSMSSGAVFMANQLSQVSLDNTIDRSVKLATFGTIVHYTGFVINCIALPATINKLRLRRIYPSREFPGAGLAMTIVGSILSAVGPLPSVAAADRIEAAFEDENFHFSHHKYRSYYVRSLVYELSGWTMYGIFTALMKDTPEKAGPVIAMVGLFLLETAAEANRGLASIGPLRYSKKARNYLEKKRSSLRLDIMPVIAMDGGVGVVSRVQF